MKLSDVPGQALLDTCVINFMLDHSEAIHDGVQPSANLSQRAVADIDALRDIFLTGQRAMWQFAVSPLSYHEVTQTEDPNRRHHLESWFAEVWQYWRSIVDGADDLPTFREADNVRVQILSSGALDVLPDPADRILLCDAVVYHCDVFCTRDWTTILKHRTEIHGIPIAILTPAEWWARIEPFASLWA